MTNINDVKVVIFDLDGTLIDTSDVVIKAHKEVFWTAFERGEIKKKPTEGDFLSTFGLLDGDILSLLAPDASRELQANYLLQHELLVRDYLVHTTCLLPGVFEMLTRLKGKYKLATASNCGQMYLESVFLSSGISHFFAYPLCAGSIDAKEKADILREIIAKEGHRDMVMIGDRYTDFEAAKNVNIPSIGIRFHFGKEEELKQANIVVDNILEIENHL